MTASAPDRSRPGRRRNDTEDAFDPARGERRREPSAAADSWLGVFDGATLDAVVDDVAAEAEARRPRAPGGAASTGRAHGATTFQRIYRLFVGARAVLGLALIGAQVTGSLLGVRSNFELLLVSLAYATQALVLWLLPRFRTRRAGDVAPRLSRTQWLATIVVDVATFSALHLLSPGASFNYVALLVLPVLMAGVLTPLLIALATAAGVALMLLLGAWRAAWLGGDAASLMTQAGLAGIGFFTITLLAAELAARLAREESSARGSLQLARQQAQLNRLVIEQMADGVMVIDRRLRVRAANPAARRLLAPQGLAAAAPFALDRQPAWGALAEAVAAAFERGAWPDAVQDVALRFDDAGLTRAVRLRARFTSRQGGSAVGAGPARADDAAPQAEALCLLFLDDLRAVQARSRQEKLAAMGRVSAGIAHEIRNPLAAIAQANALLQEDVLPPDQQRLTRIVADNAERLKRIVDDVLEVAPGAEASARLIDATGEVAAAAAEWARTSKVPLGGASRLRVRLPAEPLGVLFDPEHLRRVLVNLLDNAHRHASAAAGAIEVALEAEPPAQAAAGSPHTAARLCVASDGAPIAPDVERHLFEPFFSTRSRGTGLGLYICRELCERHGASIDYRLRPAGDAHRNVFQITMRTAAVAATESRLRL